MAGNSRIGPGDLRSTDEIRGALDKDDRSRRYTAPETEEMQETGGEERRSLRDDIESVVDQVLALAKDDQLRLLRDVLPRVAEDMDPHQRDSFMRDLLDEIERARGGKITYDIRQGSHP